MKIKHFFCLWFLFLVFTYAPFIDAQPNDKGAEDSLQIPDQRSDSLISQVRKTQIPGADKSNPQLQTDLLKLRTPELFAQTVRAKEQQAIIPEELKQKKRLPDEKLLPFSFKNRKLIEIIDLISKLKNVNIIYPQQATEFEKFKNITITYRPTDDEEITLNEAWKLVTAFLEFSGYSWFEKDKDLFAIVPTGTKGQVGITNEPLPLFVSTNPEDLPNSPERIRYVHYLQNLSVTGDAGAPIKKVIQDMSSPEAPDPIFIDQSNSFIIVDKANVVASIANIISALDETGFREVIEIIPLHNVAAASVAKTFDLLKKAAGEEKVSPFIRTETKASISFFAADTQIIPDIRNNALILMGRETAVDRLIEFIQEYMDVLPESGKSILHYYDLQYLNAKEFAKVLQEIVTGVPASQQAEQALLGFRGPQRYFQGVVVFAEETSQKTRTPESLLETIAVKTTTDSSQAGYDAKGILGQVNTGGNRLIIAALEDDWLRLKDFIQQLDRPRRQVILEVLILDITRNVDKIIAGAIRNRELTSLPNKGVDFLVDHLIAGLSQASVPNNLIGTNPQRLNEDLLQVLSGATVPPITSVLPAGSFLISFNDPATIPTATRTPGGIFALLQILDLYFDTRVISHPYLITTNNQKATISQSFVKRAPGSATANQSGVTTIPIENISATLQVQMLPRISSEDRLGLQVAVDVNDFIGSNSDPNQLNRNTRRVETNANLNTGQVLVIGGQTVVRETYLKTATPILSYIPIIGRFFEGLEKVISTTNLVIMISPTIVHTKFRDGLDLYTTDKLRKARRDIDDEIVFGETKDPIVRLFFPNSKQTTDDMVREYIEQTINAPTFEQLTTKKEQRLIAKRQPPTRGPSRPEVRETLRDQTIEKKSTDIPA